jgi:hypothetical protein
MLGGVCCLLLCFSLFSLFVLGHKVHNPSVQCSLVLKYDTKKGVGVFAGKDWAPDELMDIAIGIPIRYKHVYWTQLINYIEGYNGTHGLLTLGNTMLFNHVDDETQSSVRKHMKHTTGMYHFVKSNTNSFDIWLEPNSIVFSGEEFSTHYGNEWFDDRGFSPLLTASPSNKPAGFILPGCSTLLTIYENNRMKAARPIVAGTVIETARAILLPEWAVWDAGPLEEILWWKNKGHYEHGDVSKRPSVPTGLGLPYRVAPFLQKVASREFTPSSDAVSKLVVLAEPTDYAVLVLGRGALYHPSFFASSHIAKSTSTAAHRKDTTCVETTTCLDSSTTESKEPIVKAEPNVQYNWWEPDREGGISSFNCSSLMFVSFTALRDIQEGEPLVVDIFYDVISSRKFVSNAFASECL